MGGRCRERWVVLVMNSPFFDFNVNNKCSDAFCGIKQTQSLIVSEDYSEIESYPQTARQVPVVDWRLSNSWLWTGKVS
jgi:hypothetical protein